MPINLKQLKGQALNSLVNRGISEVTGSNNIRANFDSNGLKSISGNFNNLLKKYQRNVGQVPQELSGLARPNGGKVYSQITFPQDLDDEHYMMFHVMDRKRPSRKNVITDRALKTVVLPIPSSLQNQQGVSYQNENLQALGAIAAGRQSVADIGKAGADVVDTVLSKLGAIGGKFKGKSFGEAASELATEKDSDLGAAKAAVITTALGAATAKLGGGAIAAIGAAGGASQILAGAGVAEGIAINPHTAVLFDNVNFRSFGFNYKFIARSPEESRMIKQITDTFELAMHPSAGGYGAGFLFEYPEEFEIEFADSIKDHMFKIGRCVLTSFNVNYNGENTPLFFEGTGAPVSVEISMEFQETKLRTKENLNQEMLEERNFDLQSEDVFAEMDRFGNE